MTDNSYKFEIPAHHKSIIKVIGVGGGGSNAVNHMYSLGIQDVEFFVCNTDAQALEASPIPNKFQIGTNLTGGLGAGANPEKGRAAAMESKEEIRDLLSDGTKMVFITAGMGGGTGTGAAPVIARVAKELDILTVGIVTAPFSFEGRKKTILADEGIQELKESCDTVLVILNDKLREIYGNLPIREAFGQADNVLTTAAKGIAEIITVPGYVNVDFEDVKTVMKDAGSAVMGSAQTEGENRARRAAESAISSPLLDDRNIHGSEKILLSIISGEQAELQMDELAEITDYIQEMAGDEAEVIFGHGIDANLGESIRVTVITTGFDNKNQNVSTPVKKKQRVYDLDSTKQIDLFAENKPVEDEEPVMKTKTEEDVPLNTRTYFFERAQEKPEEEEKENNEFSDFKVNADHEYEFINKLELAENDESDNSQETIDTKKDELLKKAKERIELYKGMKNNPLKAEDDYKEKWETPAYIRRKINLQDVPHSSDRNISKFNLNDDNMILGNNKFLHDNVD